MQHEEFDMFEILQTINETMTTIQQETRDFRDEFSDYRREMYNYFSQLEDRILSVESKMVEKKDFNILIGILDHRGVITTPEAASILQETKTTA